MKFSKKAVRFAAVLTACLLTAGCGEAEQPETSGEESPLTVTVAGYQQFPNPSSSADTLSVSARFLLESGEAVAGGTVCLCWGEICAVYSLDESGELHLSGLPREGTVELTLLDDAHQELGRTTLYFSTGSVIDASTSGEGDGYITSKADTGVVTLQFTVSGAVLRTALRLAD